MSSGAGRAPASSSQVVTTNAVTETNTDTTTTVTIRRDPAAGPSTSAPPNPNRPQQPTVRWSSETVDNEHMNKKKSKKCCIYHKPRTFGEWSDTDSDGECGHCGSGH